MTNEANKQLVRRYYEELVNTGAVERLHEFLAPEYAELWEGARHALGLDGAREHVLGVRRVFPDLHLTVVQQIAEGEWVASSVIARGTHSGAWLGMQPTGRLLVMPGVNLDRVVAGRIVEHGGAVNLLGPLLEAGALRIACPAGA